MTKPIDELKYNYFVTATGAAGYEDINTLELRWLRNILGATKSTVPECYMELGTATNVTECMVEVYEGAGGTGDNLPEIAVSLFGATPPAPPPSGGDGGAWDTATFGTAMILSNGDLTASANGVWAKRYSDTSHSSGKYCFEVTAARNWAGGTNETLFGITTNRRSTLILGTHVDTWAYIADGRFFYNGAASTVDANIVADQAGDTVMVCVDFDAGKFSVISDAGSGTLVEGYTGAAFASTTTWAAINSNGAGTGGTANFGTSNFINTKPAGYTAWDGGTA